MGLLTPQAMEYLGLLGQSMLGGQSPNAGVNISQAMMFADQDMRKQAALKARLDEERQQAQLRDMQMQQMLKAQQAEEYMGKGIQQFMRPPQAATQEFRPGDMETPSQLTPASPGGFDQGGFAQYLAQNPATAQKALQFMPQQRGPEFKVVGNRLVKIEGGNASEAYAPPAEMKDWQNPEYQEWKLRERRAGAANVTTNVLPPRERFKDSVALKKDFDAQPEVKGFKEVQGAWDQISTALQKPSPANDMAAATKFMKLLDPGSVVRESELMMAMKASGALDRFANTADRILKGHYLTPAQRKDFYDAGEALFNASRDRFSQTVQQYEGIAKQYELDPQFIQNAKPRASGGWSIKKVSP